MLDKYASPVSLVAVLLYLLSLLPFIHITSEICLVTIAGIVFLDVVNTVLKGKLFSG